MSPLWLRVGDDARIDPHDLHAASQQTPTARSTIGPLGPRRHRPAWLVGHSRPRITPSITKQWPRTECRSLSDISRTGFFQKRGDERSLTTPRHLVRCGEQTHLSARPNTTRLFVDLKIAGEPMALRADKCVRSPQGVQVIGLRAVERGHFPSRSSPCGKRLRLKQSERTPSQSGVMPRALHITSPSIPTPP